MAVKERPATWSHAIDQFTIFLAEEERSASTISAYRSDLAIFHAWYHEQYQDSPELATVSAADLRGWKGAMCDAHRAPQTVNRRLAALQSFLRWAKSHDWALDVRPPKPVREEAPRPKWLARKERNALIRAVEKSRDLRSIALIKLLLHTGLRIAEAESLKWSAIQMTEKSGSVTVVGKGRKTRSVHLNVEARQALTDWAEHSEIGGRSKIGSDRRVFIGREGPLTRNALWRVVAGCGKAAGLFDLSPHLLRHTFCHDLATSGCQIQEIAALAGHESIETTRRYLEPGQEDLAAAVDRLAGDHAEPEPTPVRSKRRASK